MLAAALAHRLVVTVEDGVRVGGAGSTVAAALAEEAKEWGTPAPSVLMLGLPDSFVPHGHVEAILSELGLDAHGLAATVLSGFDAIKLGAGAGAREVVGRT
jgi:1-deoxy-D-xylulose-5-phosphate synthase